ncbi:MAG TPA: response regulator [Opitutales bacterium]|nr:response regulator [Opitutales bacterium]
MAILLWFKLSSARSKLSSNEPEENGSELVNSGDSFGSDVLFATLSHELRTPLNGLLGISQMLNEERGDEDLEAIEGCARHMLSVITAMVNHSKIRSEWSDLPEYREWVSPFELLEQIKRHLAFRAGLRGLTIKIDHQDKSTRLRGDYDHLKNIIENAILGSLECISLVHIPSETKALSLTWEADEGEMRIRMRNPLEEYSDDRRRKIRTAGGFTTGENHSRIKMEYLYWAVSSLLLEKYKGAMFAQPVEGGGVETLLSFEMEQMQSSPTSKLPLGGLALETPGSPLKAVKELPMSLSILVAEDDPIARSLMSSVLKNMGQEATFATNGREVLDLISQSNDAYDMILMDIDMPIMDGVSAAIALRNGESGEFGTKIPIVAVTAFGTLSDESKFKRAGMNYFLPKPVRLRHLREVILEVVRQDKNIR